MTAAAIALEDQKKKLEICLAVLDALSRIPALPLIVWQCVDIRIWIPKLVRRTRDNELKTEEDFVVVHALFGELRRLLIIFADSADPFSRWLLKKPLSELEDLCADLAWAADPETREAVRKIAAAVSA